jgi:hypothetical protein
MIKLLEISFHAARLISRRISALSLKRNPVFHTYILHCYTFISLEFFYFFFVLIFFFFILRCVRVYAEEHRALRILEEELAGVLAEEIVRRISQDGENVPLHYHRERMSRLIPLFFFVLLQLSLLKRSLHDAASLVACLLSSIQASRPSARVVITHTAPNAQPPHGVSPSTPRPGVLVFSL